MARGFLSGVLWGGVVGVGISSVASVMAPPPVAPVVGDVAPGVAQAPARIESASSGKTGSIADRTIVTGTVAPQAPAPEIDSAVSLDSAALTSPAQPETEAPVALDDPQTGTDTSGVTAKTDAPVIPTPQALAPMAPQVADDVVIETTPVQLPPKVDEAPTAVPVQPDEAVADSGAQPQDDRAQEQTEDVAEAEAQTETAEDTLQEDAAKATETPADTQTVVLPPEPQVAPVTRPSSVTQSQDTPEAPQAETTVLGGSARVRIGQPVGTIGDRDTGVAIRRPANADPDAAGEGDAEEVILDADTATASDDPRPISRFAQAFAPDDDKPLMAIVLIDDGSSPVTGAAGIAALRGFPYPLSFAVDSSLDDAASRMSVYRSAGFEVLAMVDLPEGAQPSDAETTFGVILPQMSDVVAVLEGTKGGLQGSRDVSDQVTSILLQTGHGLLAQDKGLNTMPKLARKQGVPADPIFRDFDSKDQTAAVIRRFLDQAAFKAGQEGAVVMLGRLRPDTISALLLWGLQDRAGKVALAPISAVLLREE